MELVIGQRRVLGDIYDIYPEGMKGETVEITKLEQNSRGWIFVEAKYVSEGAYFDKFFDNDIERFKENSVLV